MSLHDRIIELIAPQLNEEEVAYGMFYAHTEPPMFLTILFGAFMTLRRKYYVITVTSTRLFFTQINLFQRPIATTAYEYTGLEKAIHKKLLFAYKFVLVINKKKMTLVAPYRKNAKPEKMLLNQSLAESLKKHLT